jgi:hypothetical protein
MIVNDLFEYKDGKLFWKVSRSNVISIGQEAGTEYSRGYKRVYFNGKTHSVHRVIWEMFNGEIKENMQIDHIDGCPENNRIENLRIVTSQQNAMNRKSKHRLGIKNISFDKKKKKYRVTIQTQGKRIWCGAYEDLEFAELVAIEARNKYHGKFARQPLPTD